MRKLSLWIVLWLLSFPALAQDITQFSPTIFDGTEFAKASGKIGLKTGGITNSKLAGSIAASKLVGSDITTLGTITTGTWNASVVAGQYGGTGVVNTGKTITLGGNLVTSGAFSTTLTATATTSITLPTTGTLATLAGTETLTNKTLSGGTLSGTTTLPGSGQISSAGWLGVLGTPDTPFMVNANADKTATVFSFTGTIGHIVGADATAARFIVDAFGNNPSFSVRRANGTKTSPTAVQINEQLGGLTGFGYGATNFSSGSRATVLFNASENWTDSAQGAYVAFSGTPTGTATARTIGIISPNGAWLGGNLTGVSVVVPADLAVGKTAATARIYNSFTDASNGEWAYLGDWGKTANVATYGTNKNGTGSNRDVSFVRGGTEQIKLTNTGPLITSPDGFTVATGTANGTIGASFALTSTGTGGKTWSMISTANVAGIGGGKFGLFDGTSYRWYVDSTGLITLTSATLLATNVALTNGAAAAAGTLSNAPVAGNPTKWIPINDNGTTRYIPAW